MIILKISSGQTILNSDLSRHSFGITEFLTELSVDRSNFRVGSHKKQSFVQP